MVYVEPKANGVAKANAMVQTKRRGPNEASWSKRSVVVQSQRLDVEAVATLLELSTNMRAWWCRRHTHPNYISNTTNHISNTTDPADPAAAEVAEPDLAVV